ncbi:MAG: putative toxin-antitoxin system toxin component, PIN family [Rhodospirillales bacterium]|nr:putative toxin-antitoxin system toxin component, PIN family [Rhodospirillales bacterium]MDE0379232.1 putative toxin-antitoxin system toxin component, PIN family [Rhodospirillales bacterium]
MTPVRPVLDTNILVSALLFHSGALSWLRGAWRSGRIRPLAGRQTTTELIRVLAYPKFALSEGERQELLDDYLPFCETVPVPEPPPAVPQCRDPFDRPFLELALAGRADALVTGDADLLALAKDFSVPIVSPAAFREELSGAAAPSG